ncbi:MAG: hypothetical protein L3J56_10365 [Bacteroidales bacterium]|nr:hypothetical protein [Bacteroidales bacterium]
MKQFYKIITAVFFSFLFMLNAAAQSTDRDWWNSLSPAWKKVIQKQHFKGKDVTPTDEQLQEIGKMVFLDVENNKEIKSLAPAEALQLLEIIKNITIESFYLEFNSLLNRFEIKDTILIGHNRINLKTAQEDIIFNKLSNLKVVKELASYIDSISQKKRSLKLILEEEAQDSLNYITVKAVEDNGSNFVTHLIFQVQKDNLEISLYNPIKDKYEKIKK